MLKGKSGILFLAGCLLFLHTFLLFYACLQVRLFMLQETAVEISTVMEKKMTYRLTRLLNWLQKTLNIQLFTLKDPLHTQSVTAFLSRAAIRFSRGGIPTLLSNWSIMQDGPMSHGPLNRQQGFAKQYNRKRV